MVSVDDLEDEAREFFVELMPLEHAPAHVRLVFHDAGTYDQRLEDGGAHGTIRLPEQFSRSENNGWAEACMALIAEGRLAFPDLSWADLIAVAGAAAIQKCGGPVIHVGLGRRDGDQAAPTGRLPGGYEGAGLLKATFRRMGLRPRDLVALSGAHTLGHAQRRAFTGRPLEFSNAYFVELLGKQGVNGQILTDFALLGDPDLRAIVKEYATDESRFRADFADAFRRLSWLGNAAPEPASDTARRPVDQAS